MRATAIPAPEALEDLHIGRNLLEDLALKILYLEGEMSVHHLAEKMRLRFSVVEPIFQQLRKEHLCEVKGMTGHVYRIVPTSQGRARGLELLSLNQYAGPAPVPLSDYVGRVRAQSVRKVLVKPDDLRRAFEDLVLDEETLRKVGTALIAGTSIFLHGSTGTGKTAIAVRLPRIYQDEVWIPYALEIDGQIITVYDPGVHERTDHNVSPDNDGRWVLCHRPEVTTGGELTSEMLDLQFNPVTKFYAAPLQVKANNGILVIDDFGRQRVRPEEMLNRWILPLDRGIDFLTLAGGKKFEVPFDPLVVFSTNLEPTSLTDEAFLRRIQSKIRVNYMTREQFHEVFRRVCVHLDLSYDAAVVDHLIHLLTNELKQPLRACYPRDILHHICWAALYEGQLPRLDTETVTQACRNYFLPP